MKGIAREAGEGESGIPASGDDSIPEVSHRWLLDSAPDAMMLVDHEGILVLVNQQTEHVFGYRRDELLGKPFEILIPARLRQGHARHVARYFSKPTSRSMGVGLSIVGVRADGVEIPVEISLSPHQTSEGTYVFAAIRDISQRRALEAQAHLNAIRLASAVDAIEDAIAVFDATDRLVHCNRSYEALFPGSASGSLVGRSADELLAAWLPEHVLATPGADGGTDSERARSLLGRSATLDVQTNDGRTLRVQDRPTVEGGRVRTVWDLTVEMRRAKELEDARAESEAANAAKSEFLSSMSHELRTPLNAILGFAQLMQRDRKEPLSERHQRQIAQILQGGEHLLRLIDDVLDLARVEARGLTISVEPVDAVEVLREVVATLEPTASRAGIRIVVEELPAELPSVSVDRTRFAQILMNFGSNGVKYNVPDGHVTFALSLSGRHLRVAVRDGGLGVPLDRQASLFKPFQRAGQELGSIEGTGIGLSITKRLAELMGGAVGFKSAPGEGSKFWVEVPVHHERARSSAPAVDRDGPRRLGNGRRVILYVEDNPANVALMREIISRFEELELITARSAEVGLAYAREQPPDLVLMDINLPGMDGVQALRELRSRPSTRSIPVVALTAAATRDEQRRTGAAGFDRHMVKPIRVAEFEEVVGSLLG